MVQAIPAPDHRWRDHPDTTRRVLSWKAYDPSGQFVKTVRATAEGLERHQRLGWTFSRTGGLPPHPET